MTHDEIRQIVREVLGEMMAPLFGVTPPKKSDEWVSLKAAWQPLGYPSYSALYKDVQSGLFRQGKELCDRRKPGAKIARLQIDLVAARKRLREDPSNRRSV